MCKRFLNPLEVTVCQKHQVVWATLRFYYVAMIVRALQLWLSHFLHNCWDRKKKADSHSQPIAVMSASHGDMITSDGVTMEKAWY